MPRLGGKTATPPSVRPLGEPLGEQKKHLTRESWAGENSVAITSVILEAMGYRQELFVGTSGLINPQIKMVREEQNYKRNIKALRKGRKTRHWLDRAWVEVWDAGALWWEDGIVVQYIFNWHISGRDRSKSGASYKAADSRYVGT